MTKGHFNQFISPSVIKSRIFLGEGKDKGRRNEGGGGHVFLLWPRIRVATVFPMSKACLIPLLCICLLWSDPWYYELEYKIAKYNCPNESAGLLRLEVSWGDLYRQLVCKVQCDQTNPRIEKTPQKNSQFNLDKVTRAKDKNLGAYVCIAKSNPLITLNNPFYGGGTYGC